ncbi:MAG: pantetheine-phosphate adenylyltransferase [Bacteroidales bacterium]|nr:pantetheine-phosphate adenylyltransferase [Bacteroidales bacterium]
MNIALFPGSFDPITIGHESIVRRALPLFDKIYIAIGYNTNKKEFFPVEKRLEWIRQVFEGNEKIEVVKFEGLTVDYVKEIGAKFLLRGLRTSSDFEYERAIAQMNKTMNEELETVFLLTEPEHTHVNSTIVREVIRHGGDVSKFIPSKININE